MTALAAIGALLLAASPRPADLVYVTEDNPPENYVENGRLTGYAVEILRAVWTKLGVPEQPIQIHPWARGYQLALAGPRHVLFATARTPEREALFKWVGPIAPARCALFASPAQKLSLARLEDARALRVGVIRGDICERLLVERGFELEALVRVAGVDPLLAMWRAGRVDLVASGIRTLETAAAASPGAAVPTAEAVSLGVFGTWFAFSRDVDDALVARFQRALEAVDAERRAILSRERR